MKYILIPDQKKDKLQLVSPEIKSPYKRNPVKQNSSLKKKALRKQSGPPNQSYGLSFKEEGFEEEGTTNNRDLHNVSSTLGKGKTIEIPKNELLSSSVHEADHPSSSMTSA